jgi:hypothetical protein
MEHTCKICGHHEAWTSEYSQALSSANHVYKAHPAEFARLGIEVPTERPEDHGRRFELWEQQS